MKKLKRLLIMLIGSLSLSSCSILNRFIEPTIEYNENGHYYIYFDNTVSDLEDHIWIKENGEIKYTIALEPTTTTVGSKYKECEICGYKSYEAIAKTHSHNYTTLSYDERGHYYKCTICEEIGEITPHSYNDQVITPCTHSSNGLTKHTCSVCGYIYEEITSSSEHKYDTYEYDSVGHIAKCSVSGCELKQEKVAHTFQDITTPSTCTTKGHITHRCNICGYSYETELVTVDHNYELKFDTNGHYEECKDCHSRKTIQDHTYTTEVLTQPSGTTPGTRKHTCSVCGYNYTEQFNATSHNYITKYDGINHWEECEYCCEVKTDTIENHTFTDQVLSTPTSTTDGQTRHTCNECGYSYVEVVPYSGTLSWSLNTIYGGYYKNLGSWTNSTDLKSALHALIANDTPLSYGNTVIQAADEDLNFLEYVNPVYGKDLLLKTQTVNGWDKEHVFCASLMTGAETGQATKTKGRATDYHNLFASWYTGNRSRSNNNYGDAVNSTGGTFNDHREGPNNIDGYCSRSYTGRIEWEPGDIDKGRLARALCYMTIMYTTEVIDTNSGNLMKPLKLQEDYVTFTSEKDTSNDDGIKYPNTVYTEYAHGNASLIYNWAKRDVVFAEYKHNQIVYNNQKNRNPFVDFPELIDYCFGTKTNTAGSLTDLTPSAISLRLTNKIHNYAVKSYPATIEVGSKIQASDFEVVGVKDDLTQVECDNFIISGIPLNKEFEEEKTYDVHITTPDGKVLSFPIEVVEASCNYLHTFISNDLKGLKTNKSITSNLEGVNWTISTSNQVSTVQNSNTDAGNPKGIQVGSNSTSCGTITLTSIENFTYDSKSNISRIYIDGNTAASDNKFNGIYNVKFYVNDVELNPDTDYTIEYIVGDFVTSANCKLSTPVTGQIKIVISNVSKVFYLHALGVGVE